MSILHHSLKKKGYTVSALGFPCCDEVARQFEADLKRAEKDGFTYQRAKAGNVVEFKAGESADVSVS